MRKNLAVKIAVPVAVLLLAVISACSDDSENEPQTYEPTIAYTMPETTPEYTEYTEHLEEEQNAETPTPTHSGYNWIEAPVFDGVGQFMNGLAPVMIDGKYGVINVYGQVVVPIIYEALDQGSCWDGGIFADMSSGFIQARLNGRQGVIDIQGREIVPFEFDEIFIQHDYGVAVVSVGSSVDRYQGLVELATGRKIVPLGRYNRISDFGGGFAAVALRYGSSYDNRVGFIDITTGEEVIPLIYCNTRRFSEGLALVERSGNWGFINEYGEEVTRLIYELNTQPFRNGVAIVISGGREGLIDTRGNYAVPPIYDRIGIFADTPEGLALVYMSQQGEGGDLGGILDINTNELLVPIQYYGLWIVGENLAIGSTEQRVWGESHSKILIDIANYQRIATITHNFRDGHIAQFRGNYAILTVGEGWGDYWRMGLIDRTGREIFPPVYHNIRHFTDGLLIMDDNPEGRFRFQGRLVDNTTWEEVLPWQDFIGWPNHGLAVINTGGEWIPFAEWFGEIINGYWGFIDETGQIVIPPILAFERVASVSEGIAAVQVDGRWGFIRVY